MKYLDKEGVLELNKVTINTHGGNFQDPSNFLHEENLDYLLEAVKSEMFGQELYPALHHKAGLYCHSIICNHVFSDGNKRTGLLAALVFLNSNGFDLALKIGNPELTEFCLKCCPRKSKFRRMSTLVQRAYY